MMLSCYFYSLLNRYLNRFQRRSGGPYSCFFATKKPKFKCANTSKTPKWARRKFFIVFVFQPVGKAILAITMDGFQESFAIHISQSFWSKSILKCINIFS